MKADKDKVATVPALLRMKLWLGLSAEDDAWHHMQSEGEMAVFAETVSIIYVETVGIKAPLSEGLLGTLKILNACGKKN